MSEVHYYDLSANTAFKCDTMLPSRLQCPARAVVAIVPNPDIEPSRATVNHSHLCRHHFSLERALNEREGVKYIFHDNTGEAVSDVDKEYVPPQK